MPRPAWEGNAHLGSVHRVVWEAGERRLLTVVNYGATQAQCYASVGMEGLKGRSFQMVDLLSDVTYDRDGDGLATTGLYLDLPPWGHHVFDLRLIGL